MKKTITVSVNEEKLSAIEMYLGQKDTTLEAELDKFVEQTYTKVVPQNVRDFIDMMADKKPERRSGRKAKPTEQFQSEQLNQERYRMTLIRLRLSNTDSYRTVCSRIACVAVWESQSGKDTPRAVKRNLRALWASPQRSEIADFCPDLG